MDEEWRAVKDYEGLYEVSNIGRIKSLNYNGTGKEGLLKQQSNHKGYKTVMLRKDNKGKTFKVHRLVAEAFIPNPENKPQIDHINCIRDDNRVENLRWVTGKENMENPLTKDKRKAIYSEETKKKMSEAKKGKSHKSPSIETRNKISKSHKIPIKFIFISITIHTKLHSAYNRNSRIGKNNKQNTYNPYK